MSKVPLRGSLYRLSEQADGCCELGLADQRDGANGATGGATGGATKPTGALERS
jgi:hypothetical protein